MQLKDNLYRIAYKVTSEGSTTYGVELLSDSVIYKAHFPGHPITPGVCVVQIAVELLSEYIGRKLDVVSADNVKFLIPLLPEETKKVSYTFSNVVVDSESIKSQVVVSEENRVFAKLIFICKPIE